MIESLIMNFKSTFRFFTLSLIAASLSSGIILTGCSKSSPQTQSSPYDANGFDKNGIHKDTGGLYDQRGYNQAGYNRQGYDRSGFNRNGIDRYGYGRDGFHTRTQRNRNGFDRDGFNFSGYDQNGFNRAGLNPFGEHRNDLLSIEQRRSQISSESIQTPEAYLQLVRPPQTRHYGTTRTPAITSDALAELISGTTGTPGTVHRFFALNPTLDQVIQLLQQNGGTSRAQLRMRTDIKRRAFFANLCRTGQEYVRLMNANLPVGVSRTQELNTTDYDVIEITAYNFLLRENLRREDLTSVRAFIAEFPVPDRAIAHQVETLEIIDQAIAAQPELIRNRVIDHLTANIRRLIAERGPRAPEDPTFHYYLINPPHAEREIPEDLGCIYCGADFDPGHPGLTCQDEDCEHGFACHHGTELLRHVLASLENHAGVAPVTCNGLADGHEIYLSDATWARMRLSLNEGIQGLEQSLTDRGHDPHAPPGNLTQLLANLNLNIEARTQAKEVLEAKATEFGEFRKNIMLQMIREGEITRTTDWNFQDRFIDLRQTLADHIRIPAVEGPLRAHALQRRNELLQTEFAPFIHVPIYFGHQGNEVDLANIRTNLDRQLNHQEALPVVEIGDPVMTAHRYYLIADELLQINHELEVLTPERQIVLDRQTLQRNRQMRDGWDELTHRWRLQTLISYYRHLRGSEREHRGDDASRPYRFCSNAACSNLITLDQVRDGHYRCQGCYEEFCFACDHRHPGRSCEQYERERRGDAEMDRLIHNPASDIRPCPYCLVPTHRTEACYHMDCAQCGSRWNWRLGRLRERSHETTNVGAGRDAGPPREYRVRGDTDYREGQSMETAYPEADGRMVRVLRGYPRQEVPGYNPANNGGYVEARH